MPTTVTPPVAEPLYAKLWPEPWASQVAVQAAVVRGQLHRALAGPAALETGASKTRWHVEQLLRGAETATERGKLRWRGPLDRWRGTSVERAHYCLHAAKTALIDVLDENEIDARIPAAIGRVSTCLPAHDLRRLKIDGLLVAPATTLPVKRALLKNALEVGYDASDQLHSRLRAFRNLLIALSVVIFIFMAGMVALVWQSPDSVPLCFSPPTAAAQAPGEVIATVTTRTVCPSGEDPVMGPFTTQPAAQDILVVAGLGTVGGALAAAFAVRNLRGTSTPYDVPLALALLKVPTAALTAVAGLILLGGGVIPGLSELDSQGQILAWALLLGYAQQLLTQLIDKRAQNVLDAVPSKESAGSPPSLPPPAAPIAPVQSPGSAEILAQPASTTNGSR